MFYANHMANVTRLSWRSAHHRPPVQFAPPLQCRAPSAEREDLFYLGQRIGHGYETVKSRHLFRDFIDAMAHIEIGAKAISVHFEKRAHNPLLVAAGFDKTDIRVPWLGNGSLQLDFG